METSTSDIKPSSFDYNDDEPIIVKQNDQIDLTDKLTISLKTSKTHVKDTSMTLPMLLSIETPQLNKSERASIDLICVLDKSGSMKGQKIMLLIDSFTTIMEYLSDNDRLSIIVFDSKVLRLTPLIRMTQEGKERTLIALRGIKASGQTNIALAVNYALEVMRGRRITNSVTSMFILSDGLDAGAEKRIQGLLEHYKDIIRETFTIHSFGYGSIHDPVMMSSIAQLKDGSFYFIDKLDTIDEIFVDCLGGLISTVAQNMSIKVNITPDVKVIKAYGIEGSWRVNNDTYSTEILYVMSGKTYSYVFEIELTKPSNFIDDKSMQVANALVSFKDLKGSSYYQTTISEVFLIQEEVIECSQKEVLVEHYRVKTAEATNMAIKFSATRRHKEAQKLLEELKEEMKSSIVGGDIIVMNYIKDIDSSILNIKPEVYSFTGKHYLLENYQCNMNKKSNTNCNNVYMNSTQEEMVKAVRAKKTK
jgi:hypothetical protein